MFVVFDIETTGLNSYTDEIIQLAYCRFLENGTFVDSGNLYFYHKGMKWDQDVCDNVHHIQLSFLEQYANKFAENLIKAYSLLNDNTLVGHNANSFDVPFLRSWLSRMGLQEFRVNDVQDTMTSAAPLNGGHRIKLVKLCDKFDITPEIIQSCLPMYFPNETVDDWHNAVYDVVATTLCYFKLKSQGLIGQQAVVAAEKPTVLDDLVPEEKPLDPVAVLFVDNKYYPVISKDNTLYVQNTVLTDPGDLYVYGGFEKQGDTYVGSIGQAFLTLKILNG